MRDGRTTVGRFGPHRIRPCRPGSVSVVKAGGTAQSGRGVATISNDTMV